MFAIGTHVQIRLLLDAGVDDEDLDLLGRRGTIVQCGTSYHGESYGVVLDGISAFYPLEFHAVELVEVRA